LNQSDERSQPACIFGEHNELLYAARWRDSDEEAISMAQRCGLILPLIVTVRHGSDAHHYRIDATGQATKISDDDGTKG